jgi:hypothetical protein
MDQIRLNEVRGEASYEKLMISELYPEGSRRYCNMLYEDHRRG